MSMDGSVIVTKTARTLPCCTPCPCEFKWNCRRTVWTVRRQWLLRLLRLL